MRTNFKTASEFASRIIKPGLGTKTKRSLQPLTRRHTVYVKCFEEIGIDSISLNPDTVMQTTAAILEKEKALKPWRRQ